MPYFRVRAARGSEKLDFLIRASDIGEATNEVHKSGYTILSIEEQANQSNEKKQIFYFDAFVILPTGAKEKKTGQIQSDDAFHAYQTLVEQYNCQIERIYTDIHSSDEDKLLVTAKVADAYHVYLEQKNTKTFIQNIGSNQSKTPEKKTGGTQSLDDDLSPVLKKEIALYQGLIDTVLFKIENITSKYNDVLSSEKRATLQLLYSTLRQTKNITNIAKLKLVGETALKKIGELEVDIVRKQGGEQKNELLKETNNLLKQFGSKTSVGGVDNDVSKKVEKLLRSWTRDITNFFALLSASEEGDKKTSTGSVGSGDYGYYNQLQRLELYREKLAVNQNLYKLEKDETQRDRISAKIRLIEQNIALINARVGGKEVSYTRIVKGIYYYQELFVFFFQTLSRVGIATTLFYSLFYFGSTIFFHDFLIRLDLSLPYALIFLSVGFVFSFVRGYKSGILSVFGVVPMIIFILVNTTSGIG
ncbi:MAG: hypothetical protein U0518_01565 [Candidatus Gracilibacteria bacterium]